MGQLPGSSPGKGTWMTPWNGNGERERAFLGLARDTPDEGFARGGLAVRYFPLSRSPEFSTIRHFVGCAKNSPAETRAGRSVNICG